MRLFFSALFRSPEGHALLWSAVELMGRCAFTLGVVAALLWADTLEDVMTAATWGLLVGLALWVLMGVLVVVGELVAHLRGR